MAERPMAFVVGTADALTTWLLHTLIASLEAVTGTRHRIAYMQT
jgi:hypothetical protein